MQRRISAYQYRASENFFEFLEVPVVVRFQNLRHIRVDTQNDILSLHRLGDFLRFHQNLADDRLHAFYVAGAVAIRAWSAKRALEALLDALTRDGYQSKIVELQNLVWRLIRPHGLFK